MLTSKQRATLRAIASNTDTIFQIGKGGITEEICNQLSNALEARELIKLRVLENSGYTAKEAAAEIAEVIGCDVTFNDCATNADQILEIRERVNALIKKAKR